MAYLCIDFHVAVLRCQRDIAQHAFHVTDIIVLDGALYLLTGFCDGGVARGEFQERIARDRARDCGDDHAHEHVAFLAEDEVGEGHGPAATPGADGALVRASVDLIEDHVLGHCSDVQLDVLGRESLLCSERAAEGIHHLVGLRDVDERSLSRRRNRLHTPIIPRNSSDRERRTFR